MARLFDAARLLWAAAPWEQAMDFQVLRLDIPSRGVEGACVSIMGYAGDRRGLVVFPSLEDFEALAEAAPTLSEGARHVDLGTGWLALTYASARELPRTMRREAMEHGWAVAGADAYPRVERRERDGVLRPLVERDLQIASRCATAIAAFSLRHGHVFGEEELEPVCESQLGEDDVEVRLTMPYEAYDDFDVPEVPATSRRESPRVGRNDPCPCGSGRKYKKCHLARDEAQDAARGATDRLRDADRRMVRELLGFAIQRFGDDWESHAGAFADVNECLQLAVPWGVYGYRVGGRTAAEVYLEERGARLSHEERSWLEAQRAAWLSVWEVTRVEPGEALALRDLLSGEERRVSERSASREVVVGDALLARVVDCEGTSVLSGAHPHPLPPPDAADLVRRARGRLRLRRAVPVERLRDPEFGRYLIGRWDAAIDAPEPWPQEPPAGGGPARAPSPAEAEQIVLAFKRAHYADWPDHPLPALGGRTPREAVRRAEGRRAVGRLLDEMERDERREGATAFDFGTLRRELRLK